MQLEMVEAGRLERSHLHTPPRNTLHSACPDFDSGFGSWKKAGFAAEAGNFVRSVKTLEPLCCLSFCVPSSSPSPTIFSSLLLAS